IAATAVVSFLVGALVAGRAGRSTLVSGASQGPVFAKSATSAGNGPLINFAEVVQRINPAVVNIEATSRAVDGRRRRRRLASEAPPDSFTEPFDCGSPWSGRDPTRRGAGSGFIIDADGSILTNNHVIDRADRIAVKFADGRSLRARVIGTDADTDIALIKVDGQPD